MTEAAPSRRIGAVTIAPSTEKPADLPFDLLYQRIGMNTGNYMFTQAMYRNIAGQVEPIGFSFDPDRINAEFDHVVIPAANWLSAKIQWDFLIPLLERLTVPVTTIGIGLQAETTRLADVEVSDSARRLVAVMADKGASISTRGNFTAEWLQSIGIGNVVTTGCPSIYMEVVADPKPAPDGPVALQSTRYGMSRAFLDHDGMQQRVFRLAGEMDLDMIYQSEIEEIGYKVYGPEFDRFNMPGGQLLPQLYGFQTKDQLQDYLDRRGRVYFSIDHWADFVKSASVVAGTRLHGAIIALNAGATGILFPHDSRTQEMVDFAAIPTLDFDTFATALRAGALADLGLDDLTSRFRSRRRLNRDTYARFLRDNGLTYVVNTLVPT